jgi:PAS domain S-box-containing protein
MPSKPNENPQQRAAREWERLERAEGALWRNSILLLVALAVGLALASWSTILAIPFRSQVLAVGLVVLVGLFGIYVWQKKRELAEIRGLLRGLHEAASNPPTEAQVDKLLEVISKSQRGYRDLIDSLDHAVFTLSPQGSLRVVNRYMAQVLGLPVQDLIGRQIDDFCTEPSLEQSRRGLANLLEAGSWFGRIGVKLKKPAERRFFDCRFQLVRADGQVTGINGWARDVTAQHESEIRFADLFESLSEGIFFTTPEGQILDANPALVRMLGFEHKDELQRHNFADFYADSSVRQGVVDQLSEHGSLQGRELALRRKDGSRMYCIGSGFAIRDTFGRVVRLQGTFVDITERREMERRLHQEQEFVRRLVASFPDMIAVLDREGRFTYVSPRVREVMGEMPHDYVGQQLGERMHPDDRPGVMQKFSELTNGQATYAQVEFRSQHADGSWRMLRVSAGPLFDAAGKINGVVASARDITEQKHSEQQLTQKEKWASMGQMMAGVAHELNNPLTAILGVGELLRERAADDRTQRQVEIVLQQARRAASIIQNLLVLSRPAAAGRGKLRVEDLVKRAVEAHKASLAQKNIEVTLECADGLPEIEGNPRLLGQVFSNLIENAEQAIASVRDHGTLQIWLRHADGKVSATFHDDGPGIPSDKQARIFDPFFTTKRPGGGTGLGLTICLALVKEHGGTIDVESLPGSGATFLVTLPVAANHANLSAPQRPREITFSAAVGPTPTKPDPSPLQGHSLLVIEDEDSIREIVQEGLSARGMKVEGSSNAEEAFAHLQAATYDIILCDFNLPGLKGEPLFARLRGLTTASAPRFVFMTGDLLDPTTIETFKEKGATVLQKPFHVAALARLLSDLLRSRPQLVKT